MLNAEKRTRTLVILLCSMLLLAFGWRLLHQHWAVEQQTEVRREEAADLMVARLEQAVRQTEDALRNRDAVRAAATTPDSITVIFAGAHVEALPYGRLLYHPVASPGFASEEADALIRTAHTLRRSGRHDAALAAYETAARMAWTAIGEVPTELFARAARCELLAAVDRTRELRTEALELRELLLDGRWRITRPTFESYLKASTRWSRAGEPPSTERLALSEAVQRLYVAQPLRAAGHVVQPFKAAVGQEPRNSERSTMTADGVEFTILVQTLGTRTTALVAGPLYAAHVWKSQVNDLADQYGVQVDLVNDLRGGPLTEASLRRAEASGLPWTVVVKSSRF